MGKGWMIVGLGWALIGLVGCEQAPTAAQERARIDQGVEAILGPRYTYAKYVQIQPGMTQVTVEGILGRPGEELSRNQIAGYATVVYSWRNRDGSNLHVLFQSDGVVQKGQFGLH
jgi:hypothetical protein